MEHFTLWAFLFGLSLCLADGFLLDGNNSAAAPAHWDYTGANGPDHWMELFPTGCTGTYQSPINIVTQETVYNPALDDFVILYEPLFPGSKFVVQNNGHTIQVNTVGKFFVEKGGLPNVFSTAQFHFHWGNESGVGSEHTIDGQASPMELHIVNWNSDKYGSFSEAMVQPDGLAVLGMLFEISSKDNPIFDSLIAALASVRDPDMNVTVDIASMPMREFLPQHPQRYYRYKGSLTTPGCFESVTWTVFAEKLSISSSQLDAFRHELKSAHLRRRRLLNRQEKAVQAVLSELGIKNNLAEKLRFKNHLENAQLTKRQTDHGRQELVNNYRPVQPLNSRTVFRSFLH